MLDVALFFINNFKKMKKKKKEYIFVTRTSVPLFICVGKCLDQMMFYRKIQPIKRTIV